MENVLKVMAQFLEDDEVALCRANFSRSLRSRAIRDDMLSSIWPWKEGPDLSGPFSLA